MEDGHLRLSRRASAGDHHSSWLLCFFCFFFCTPPPREEEECSLHCAGDGVTPSHGHLRLSRRASAVTTTPADRHAGDLSS